MQHDEPATSGPCWVELATIDAAAATVFYTGLFGWRAAVDQRPEAAGYTVLTQAQGPVAALAPQYREGRPPAWTVSFLVEDADATAARITEAGGRVLLGPVDVLELGRYTAAADPSGAVFALWQARDFGGAAVLGKPNSLGWVELHTRDVAACAAFYTAVFGWGSSAGQHYTQWRLAGRDFAGMVRMDDSYPAEVPAHWLPYFAVADVDAIVNKAAGHGAERVMGPMDVPDGPRIAVLRDRQGAAFGVYLASSLG
ncbi:VOC family protein [Kitasatospora sp. RB6PN24]|uniref:VOC family protein n=1 Tax=Kitasatospora humi TaxID=2893891 RepID=UPI001E39FB98|nr:VOC family protein [Kitasatospora humi]MCC9310626.1 VOC family protein [Kitasatospora humi]